MEITDKKCTKCKSIKLTTEFNKNKKSSDGLRFECKACQKAHYVTKRDHYISKMKENRLKKLDEYVKRDKDYYEIKKTEILKKKQKYHLDNNQILCAKARKYYHQNKIKRNAYNKQWIHDNIEYYREYRKEYSKQYRLKYPHIILWRSTLTCTLKRMGKLKEGHTIDLLGYSALDLKNHIESLFIDGMSWDNHGEWHVDHIKPVSKYDSETPMSVVNALTNLQPLWGSDNISKGNN